MQVMKKMAVVVDDQNKNDPLYEPMSQNFDTSIAFKAACELVFEGLNQPSGYTAVSYTHLTLPTILLV